MAILILGLVLFMGTHFYSAFRTRGGGLEAKIGAGPFRGLYSVVSLIGFGLIVWGYAASQPSPSLFVPPIWTRHLTYLLVPVALIVLMSGYAPAGYIRQFAKHPMLLSIKIWAVAHLLANGELNALLLFGSFLAFGVVDRIAAKRRGDTGAVTAPTPIGDLIAIGSGLALSAVLILWLHPILFGRVIWPIA